MAPVTPARSDSASGITAAQLEDFFGAARSELEVMPKPSQIDLREAVGFFDAAAKVIKEAEIQESERNRTEARRFNVFSLIKPDENRLSDILADLLDPDGPHGQGNLFLRLLLEQLGI